MAQRDAHNILLITLSNIGDAIMTMAEAEHLQAHSNAVAIRLKSRGDG